MMVDVGKYTMDAMGVVSILNKSKDLVENFSHNEPRLHHPPWDVPHPAAPNLGRNVSPEPPKQHPVTFWGYWGFRWWPKYSNTFSGGFLMSRVAMKRIGVRVRETLFWGGKEAEEREFYKALNLWLGWRGKGRGEIICMTTWKGEFEAKHFGDRRFFGHWFGWVIFVSLGGQFLPKIFSKSLGLMAGLLDLFQKILSFEPRKKNSDTFY